ncbi:MULTISPECIES: lipoyl protein ligase domain-containing protein [unclassified Caballeronia]|uniref:lipoyl protein ligase domain-containing protein n=1 Tax=unclassified Caballeronia TaxID=2646786 RepID=UPI0028622A32|nr:MULTISPECIES: lipoate--protein ligase family protein [unclassified Caballeronia]MDR5740893.1 lipoate--protein ligase family protein [Caballeronia sp. LZ016]MDR5808586.1 lipoate--protein ligase family protein [Caballeronia sp. LZ019]
MPFELLDPASLPGDPLDAEEALLARASAGHAVAHLWTAPVSLIVPRSYQRYAPLADARAAFAQRGCPVWLRLSGGGLVPQGPGILNLSLAYPVRGTMGALAEPVYLHLCGTLADALNTLGVLTHHQAVEGSFCDGRFNLAWGPGGDARKIAGTAQYWRRAPEPSDDPHTPRYAVLAHAVLLVNADPIEINERANAFEAMIGSGRRYEEMKVVTVAQALAYECFDIPADLFDRVRDAVAARVARSALPEGS